MPGSRLRRAAFAAHRAGRFEEALDLYARAREQLGPVTSATPPPVLTELARVAAGEASTRWARGELAEAAPLAARALDLAERCGDHAALADAHVADALLRAAAGDRPGNARAYDVALEHATAAGERDTVVRILTNIGSRLNEEGQHEAAVHRLEQALTLLAAAPDAVTDTDTDARARRARAPQHGRRPARAGASGGGAARLPPGRVPVVAGALADAGARGDGHRRGVPAARAADAGGRGLPGRRRRRRRHPLGAGAGARARGAEPHARRG